MSTANKLPVTSDEQDNIEMTVDHILPFSGNMLHHSYGNYIVYLGMSRADSQQCLNSSVISCHSSATAWTPTDHMYDQGHMIQCDTPITVALARQQARW